MRIAEIRIDRTKSLGNYENLKLGFTVVVEEGESEVGVIERARRLLDWEINKDERDAKYRQFKQLLATGEKNERTPSLEEWVAEYELRAKEFSAETV